jgi:hypothetical protein
MVAFIHECPTNKPGIGDHSQCGIRATPILCSYLQTATLKSDQQYSTPAAAQAGNEYEHFHGPAKSLRNNLSIFSSVIAIIV